MNLRAHSKIMWLVIVVAFCLFGITLEHKSSTIRETTAIVSAFQVMLLVCVVMWCGILLLLTFTLNDIPLVCLLAIAIAVYFIGPTTPALPDVFILLAGVSIGKAVKGLVSNSGSVKTTTRDNSETRIVNYELRMLLFGVSSLLAFSSCWQLNAWGPYHGPRWMGLWDNPNDYGMLMGAGVVLAAGLLGASRKSTRLFFTPARQAVQSPQLGEKETEDGRWKMEDGAERRRPESEKLEEESEAENGKRKTVWRSAVGNWQMAILLVAIFMTSVGLVMSYSRGAWVGAAVGLLYLAKSYGKFKWRWGLPPALVALAVICFFWHNTSDNAQWYLKRLDLSRASAQHRVAAWKAGFAMLRDRPFGVGWNTTEKIYRKNYSPPEGGASAIVTNDYLMLGTQLGLPGLICFVAYVALCFRNRPLNWLLPKRPSSGLRPPSPVPTSEGQSAGSGEGIITSPVTCHLSLQTACRAGALALLVAFWFDGGLFKLATASVFWILLELSQIRNSECGVRNAEMGHDAS